MKIPGSDGEVFVGGQPDPTMAQAQAEANTQAEDQDDDPDTTAKEKARIWRLLEMSPDELD